MENIFKEKTFTMTQVVKLLNQQAYVNALENAFDYEWEYGNPRRGDVYGEMAKVQREVFNKLLDELEITPEAITPYVPEVEVEDEDDDNDIIDEGDKIEICQDDLDLVRKRLNMDFDDEEEEK